MIYLIFFVVALIILFIIVPKKAAIVFSVAALVVLGVGGLIYWNDLLEKNDMENVNVILTVDRTTCGDETPLKYVVQNDAVVTVYRVYFRYSAYREGYSSPVSKSYSNDVTENKILEPQSQHLSCIALPEFTEEAPEDELLFTIDHKRVWFEPPIR